MSLNELAVDLTCEPYGAKDRPTARLTQRDLTSQQSSEPCEREIGAEAWASAGTGLRSTGVLPSPLVYISHSRRVSQLHPLLREPHPLLIRASRSMGVYCVGRGCANATRTSLSRIAFDGGVSATSFSSMRCTNYFPP